nr:sugar-binding domain-containing protein [Sinobaca sp. H24]
MFYNFAKAYKANRNIFDSAAIVQSKKIRDDILYSGYMQDVTNLWKRLSIAVIGIGAPIRSSNLVWAGFLDNGEDKLLEEEKVIGDVCSRFYTIDGKETTSELKDRAVAIELDALKETKATIAGGGIRRKNPLDSRGPARWIYQPLCHG